jgi:hypothetical protein
VEGKKVLLSEAGRQENKKVARTPVTLVKHSRRWSLVDHSRRWSLVNHSRRWSLVNRSTMAVWKWVRDGGESVGELEGQEDLQMMGSPLLCLW